MIKKFKNGKLKLSIKKGECELNGEVNESFYHDEMFMSDLYINQINGYMYITDYNKQLVYDLGSYLMQNPLKYLLDELEEKGVFYFNPYSKKESASLLQDLENGY